MRISNNCFLVGIQLGKNNVMKICGLNVVGLFGLYDYSISFKDSEDNFTIITSPNGYGKTTILKIINSLDVKRLYYLYLLKFTSIEVSFDDESVLSLQEINSNNADELDSDIAKNRRLGLSMRWLIEGNEICRFEYKQDDIYKAKDYAVRQMPMRSVYSKDVLKEEDFTYGELGEALNSRIAKIQGQEQFLLQLATLQINLIEANRIYPEIFNTFGIQKRNDPPIIHIIEELRDKLSNATNGFLNKVQQLDSEFIEILLKEEVEKIDREKYESKAAYLTEKISELANYGLARRQTIPSFNDSKSNILSAYIKLMEKKYSYYDVDILPSIKLFNEKVNQKRFTNKNIIVSVQHGLRIESVNGDILDADMLSSGEQNELVILYDLIFKTPIGSILLIDEPENSLHVAWLNTFVEDVLTIIKQRKLQIIVASHSPTIVSDALDSQVIDLYYNQKVKDA